MPACQSTNLRPKKVAPRGGTATPCRCVAVDAHTGEATATQQRGRATRGFAQAPLLLLIVFLFPATVCAETPEDSLAAIARAAPTIAEAIRADADLKTEIGPEKWPRALAQLARFVQGKDPECREAVRIIGDLGGRTKAPVGAITVDGDPAEWSGAVPSPEYMRLHAVSQDRKEETPPAGVAAVVRDDRLYIMVGLPAAYFDDRNNAIRVTIDCMDGPAWDARLSILRRSGRWTGTWTPADKADADAKPLGGLVAAAGKAAEFAIDIRDFAPTDRAKPMWTLVVSAKQKTGQGAGWVTSRFVPVFNETAPPSVAAGGPYVRTFLMLCADAEVEESDRVAAATAIMSALMYQCGNDDVRRQLRADNAAFLALAREIEKWQSEIGARYRLKDYPLEAQLAWAFRTPRSLRFFESGRDAARSANDRENYYWSSTSVDTLRELRAVAVKEGLADPPLRRAGETARKIDRWVLEKQDYSRSPAMVEARIESTDDPAEEQQLRKWLAVAKQRQQEAEVVGQFHGRPVSEFRLSHSETLLAQIRKRGRTLGVCQHHAFLVADMMRAVGMAPVEFSVDPSRSDKIPHTWPAYYDPEGRSWRSYQAGRKDSEWWYFNIIRLPVYTYAAETPHLSFTREYGGPRPLPLIFSRELQGFDIQKLMQKGIDAATVRQWMLTPGLR